MPLISSQEYAIPLSFPAAAANVSATVDLINRIKASGFYIEVGVLTGWITASITLQVSRDGFNWFDVRDATTEAKIIFSVMTKANSVSGRLVPIGVLGAYRFVRATSVTTGTPETPVNQTTGFATLNLIIVDDPTVG